MDWQKEALSQKRVLVRAARRAGKTLTAVKWARNAGKRVLFAVPYQHQVGTIFDMFELLYPEEILRIQRSRGTIAFQDGVAIDIIHNQREMQLRGLRVDAVVLDDVGYMTDNAVLSAMLCGAHRTDFAFFASYTTLDKNGVKRIEKLGDVEHVHRITVDYLDLLESGRLCADDVRSLKSSMSAKAFAEELGPYEQTQRTVKPKNKLFTHLLSKEKGSR